MYLMMDIESQRRQERLFLYHQIRWKVRMWESNLQDKTAAARRLSHSHNRRSRIK